MVYAGIVDPRCCIGCSVEFPAMLADVRSVARCEKQNVVQAIFRLIGTVWGLIEEIASTPFFVDERKAGIDPAVAKSK